VGTTKPMLTSIWRSLCAVLVMLNTGFCLLNTGQAQINAAGTLAFAYALPDTNVLESVGMVTICVSRFSDASGAVTVQHRDLNPFGGSCPGTTLTLTNQDYILNGSGTLSWADGDDTDKCFTITIND